MPFQSLPIPLTYVDVSQVTDPEHERLKVTFENGMVVMLQKSVDDYNRSVLAVDRHNSDALALEPALQACYANQKNYKTGTRYFGVTVMKQVTNYTRSEIDDRVYMQITLDYRDLVYSPLMPGHPLTVLALLPKEGGSGSTLANGSLVTKIESVVLDG